jgi:hypothetical protein
LGAKGHRWIAQSAYETINSDREVAQAGRSAWCNDLLSSGITARVAEFLARSSSLAESPPFAKIARIRKRELAAMRFLIPAIGNIYLTA